MANQSAPMRIRPGMTMRRSVLALVLGTSAMTLLPGSTAHAAGICLGHPATIEASSGEVAGTPGNDVIVVSGTVKYVDAGNGNDLICLVDTAQLSRGNRIFVTTGHGEDEVDASTAGAKTSTSLGPGADSFTGSDFDDYVVVGDWSASLEEPGEQGPYTLSTGTGKDHVLAQPGSVIDADLGRGADAVGLGSVEGGAASHVDLGAGRDTVTFADEWEEEGAGETSLKVDMVRDTARWHGVTSVVIGVEHVQGTARRVTVRGDAGPNDVRITGCDVMLKGRGGDDDLSISTSGAPDIQPFACRSGEARRANGGGGDDWLRGGRKHDVLVGGPGRDKVHGGPAGHDVCIAEIVTGKGCLG